ncbi:hypothetical protein PHYBLDRAFT_144584 [Rhizophagus clarus]|uniref:Uncharacterized protein n=1 Tax=Rhizophagus clarus TaxID=94130 RepID=A0A8H3R4J5_9GLOM|nr:hypothetical protein PHYBLDRAFT_144584 [Rhizophagus clarus]
MPRKTKRQQQVSKIPRKKGHYVFKNKIETEIKAIENEEWKEEFEREAKGMRTLDTLFVSVEVSTSKPLSKSLQSLQTQFPFLQNPSIVTEEITRNLQEHLNKINQQCSITKSAETNKNIYTYDYLRCLSIRRYIQLLLDGWGKMDASNQIAQSIWNKGDYTARCIRKWKAHFIKTGELFVYCQRKHTKLEKSRTPRNLKLYIEGMVFPKLTGHIKKDTISEKTCRNYMYLWGYKYDERKKGVYYDRHECPDVVKYRKEWSERMFEYQKFIKDFEGDMIDIVSEPELKPEEKEFVQVTHDECHFYANDGQRRI